MVPEHDDQPACIECEPAFLLEEGIGYVREWARAQHAVSALQQALAASDHPEALPYLHADVNVFGTGVVELGRVTPETAAFIAEALQAFHRGRDRGTGEHAA
jgi:hypothetical protein